MINLNCSKVDPTENEERSHEARVDFDVCLGMRKPQRKEGRHILHEHQPSTISWREPGVVRLVGIDAVINDQRSHVQSWHDPKYCTGTKTPEKGNGFLSNSLLMGEDADRVCIGDRDHISKTRNMQAQICPPSICRAMCRGMKRQKQMDAMG